jgi:hypothetical protein
MRNGARDCYLTNIRRVDSPHAETGGFIRKKTIIATLHCIITSGSNSTKQPRSIQFVSFHGYNGQPFKKVSFLVDHVQAVLDVLDSSDSDVETNDNNSADDDDDAAAAVFAGDFNTWSQAHLDAVQVPLQRAGFRHVLSWPYPGRDDFALDHVFIRGRSIQVQADWSIFQNASDHQGALHCSRFAFLVTNETRSFYHDQKKHVHPHHIFLSTVQKLLFEHSVRSPIIVIHISSHY